MNGTFGNLACKEEPRVEVIGGKVVMLAAPSALHEVIAGKIYRIFGNYLEKKRCMAFSSNTAVYLEDGEEYQPDVKVVCDRSKVKHDGIHGAPDLVVEVLSPSTGSYDRGRKMQVYERCGVREYWIVDPVIRSIEQYLLEEGRFVLRDIYMQLDEEDLKMMSEKRRAEMVKEFHCSLFDDLTISVDDVFAEVGEW